LALKKEQLEAEIAKGRERLALEKGRAERDIGSRLEEVGLREAELDTRESLLHKQEKALDTMENDLRNMIRTQIANEIKLQAEQLDSRASELQVSENTIKVKEAELRAWEQRLSKKARDRDTKPGVVYEFRYPPTHAPVYVGRTTRDDPIKRIEEHLEDALNNENDFRTWIYNLYHNEHMLPEVAIVYETSGEAENRRVERQHINDLLSRGAMLFNVQRKVPLVDIKRELLVAEVAGE
jgi:hypothetical protein